MASSPHSDSPFLRITFSTPLAVIAYFLIWFVPDFHQGQTLWYLLFYCLFETLVTVSAGSGKEVPGASGVGAQSHICLSIV